MPNWKSLKELKGENRKEKLKKIPSTQMKPIMPNWKNLKELKRKNKKEKLKTKMKK
jgi:hypothetical protein